MATSSWSSWHSSAACRRSCCSALTWDSSVWSERRRISASAARACSSSVRRLFKAAARMRPAVVCEAWSDDGARGGVCGGVRIADASVIFLRSSSAACFSAAWARRHSSSSSAVLLCAFMELLASFSSDVASFSASRSRLTTEVSAGSLCISSDAFVAARSLFSVATARASPALTFSSSCRTSESSASRTSRRLFSAASACSMGFFWGVLKISSSACAAARFRFRDATALASEAAASSSIVLNDLSSSSARRHFPRSSSSEEPRGDGGALRGRCWRP